MDKKTVFADEIELATSSVFYKNGVIVLRRARTSGYFEDTNGDDKADKRSEALHESRQPRHARRDQQHALGPGWLGLCHARLFSSTEDAKSGDGSKSFGPIGAGVVRFKPDGSAFEQYASRGGNTWGLDITWDGQVFYTQPTSGNHFIHVVLPEYVLAKGKLPGVSGTNGMLPKEPTYPAMHWEQQAYVQIDQVGSYTAAAGCAIYEGGAWPAKWNYGYFTTEPTLNIVSHFMVEPDGVTYKAKREPGREQTEFIPQQEPLVPPHRESASARMERSTSSISATRPSFTTIPAAPPTAPPTPPFAPTATTTTAASGRCSTSRRRSSPAATA